MHIKVYSGLDVGSEVLAMIPLDVQHFREQRVFTFNVYDPTVVVDEYATALTPLQLGKMLDDPWQHLVDDMSNRVASVGTTAHQNWKGKQVIQLNTTSNLNSLVDSRRPRHSLASAFSGIGTFERLAAPHGGYMRVTSEKLPHLQEVHRWLFPDALPLVYGD